MTLRILPLQRLFALCLFVFSVQAFAQEFNAERARTISAQSSRPSAEWVCNGIIYEIYPRSFLPREHLPASKRNYPN